MARRDARAADSDIDLDENAKPAVHYCGRLIECGDISGVVDGGHEMGMTPKIGQPRDLLISDDLVGDEDIPDPRARHDLGVSKLRAGHADRSRFQEHVRDRWDLNALCMGPPGDPSRFACTGNARDVRLKYVEIDEEYRRVEPFLRKPDWSDNNAHLLPAPHSLLSEHRAQRWGRSPLDEQPRQDRIVY